MVPTVISRLHSGKQRKEVKNVWSPKNVAQAQGQDPHIGPVVDRLSRAWKKPPDKKPGARLHRGGKGKNRGQIGKISASKVSLAEGWGGEEQWSLETCLWCRRSMIPDSGIMLWLVKCLHVDRFVVLLTVSCSFNITLLQLGKRFFKHEVRASNTNFFARLFAYPSAPRRAKTMPVTCCKKKKKHSKFHQAFFSAASKACLQAPPPFPLPRLPLGLQCGDWSQATW